MQLTILSEAKAMDGFFSEHGLSFLIEEDGKKILLDTGASDVFLKNAYKLGIDLKEVDTIVLSHGHWDHGNGLQHISGKPLLCHPLCFQKRYRKLWEENIGLALEKEEIEERFEVKTSCEPVQLTEHLWFLGEVPRLNDFEAQTTKYLLEDGSPDFIIDDSGLALTTENGLVVISGCAHSGICNMVEHAKNVTGLDRVEAVIGGFHLKAVNPQTRQTVQWMKDAGVPRLLPSHCTMGPALELFQELPGSAALLVGNTLHF
jgi:7,8-dihydropterin-6-yl-methyl-4-(beta-D-ribofuranosyl)aminobenzene 5'-phosphate synthase